MIRGAGIAGVALVLAMVMLFSRWNGAERVTLDLGFWTFYRVPLVYVAFGGIFVGMVVMLLANLHADIRVRRFLRDRLEEEGREERERIDRYQRDLFRPDPDEDGPPTDELAGRGALGPTPSQGSEPGDRPAADPGPGPGGAPPVRPVPPPPSESSISPDTAGESDPGTVSFPPDRRGPPVT